MEGDAYSEEEFDQFYNVMVSSLPAQFEVGVDTDWLFHIVEELILRNNNINFLDVCCGSGRISRGLASKFVRSGDGLGKKSMNLFGIDRSRVMLESARHQWQQCGLEAEEAIGMNFVEGSMADILKTNLREKSFDCIVISAGSLHHALSEEERLAILEGCCSLLRNRDSMLVLTRLVDDDVLGDVTGSIMKCINKINGDEWRKVVLGRTMAHFIDAREQSVLVDFSISKNDQLIIPQTEWALRTIYVPKMIDLAKKAKLSITKRFPSFSAALKHNVDDGCCSCDDERDTVFVFQRES